MGLSTGPGVPVVGVSSTGDALGLLPERGAAVGLTAGALEEIDSGVAGTGPNVGDRSPSDGGSEPPAVGLDIGAGS